MSCLASFFAAYGRVPCGAYAGHPRNFHCVRCTNQGHLQVYFSTLTFFYTRPKKHPFSVRTKNAVVPGFQGQIFSAKPVVTIQTFPAIANGVCSVELHLVGTAFVIKALN